MSNQLIYSPTDCPFNPAAYPSAKKPKGNRGGQNKKAYINAVCAFDIETTTLPCEQALMYVWQMQLEDYTVMGRTWDECLSYFEQLSKMAGERVLVFWVHNLSFEFQFLQGVYHFSKDDVFAVKSRKILKATMFGNIELRCSYLQSNMSLDAFTKKMGCEVKKLTGTFDYSLQRFPDTPLTETEIAYCVNDVRSLVEAIKKEMMSDEDNLCTIPLTSTGYVRRQAKKTMRTMYGFYSWIRDQLPDYDLYTVLREAFRGGNTHASRFYSGQILKNVHSIDRSSSYPDVLVNCKFPVSKFRYRPGIEFEQLRKEIRTANKAAVFRIHFENIHLIDEFYPCPYLSRDKCRNYKKVLCDNGRILTAAELDTTLTDIDLEIIDSQYTWKNAIVHDVYTARYGYLPQPFRDLVNYYYKQKTQLKGVEGQELYYDKFKARVNALYGMCAQDPVKDAIVYDRNLKMLYTLAGKDPAELLQKSNRKAFLSYAVGVWTTAHARRELQEMIDLAGLQFVYADTDSVKYIGELDYSEYNDRIRERSISNGAYADDPKGNRHYMGIYEEDAEYQEFITLGAKKYAYKINDQIKVTVAGVNKKEGGKELAKRGGLAAFKPGFTFYDAGGTEAIYNDHGCVSVQSPAGHTYTVTPNVVIKESTYTLGITGEYTRILHSASRLRECLLRAGFDPDSVIHKNI